MRNRSSNPTHRCLLSVQLIRGVDILKRRYLAAILFLMGPSNALWLTKKLRKQDGGAHVFAPSVHPLQYIQASILNEVRYLLPLFAAPLKQRCSHATPQPPWRYASGKSKVISKLEQGLVRCHMLRSVVTPFGYDMTCNSTCRICKVIGVIIVLIREYQYDSLRVLSNSLCCCSL